MDSLDQIAGPATPLLTRVDDLLSTAGAPADHPVWAELRRVRLLPGDAVHAVAALRSADLLDAAPELRAGARAYAALAESLPPPTPWTGDAADAYDAVRRRVAEHLSGTAQSLDERLEATADLADALVDWVDQTRGDLAGTLAYVLTSTEALELTSDGRTDPAVPGAGRAAADVAERILHTVAESYEQAADLLYATADLATAALHA
jgi:hypothetical protein